MTREMYESDIRKAIQLASEALDPDMDVYAAMGRLVRARDHLDTAARDAWLATPSGREAARKEMAGRG